MAKQKKPNELHLTRVYDAPVKMVWEVFTDPKHVGHWWGPRGFTLTTHSKDLKSGGHWNYTMHGPDGTDYENRTYYHEVEKHKKLVYDHGANENQPPLFKVTVLFSESKGKTTMEMTMALKSEEAAKEIAKFIKMAGGNSTWDRLAEYLEKETSGKEKFFINRTFNADIGTLFEMWVNPKHFEKWLGPVGVSMKFLRADIQEGSSAFYRMTGDAGLEMYGQIEYLKINRPDLIVYNQQFADKNGNISRHPHMPTWPETMQTTVRFIAESENETRVTVEWEPVGKVSADELAAFIKERGGMTQGWTGSFDKLEKLLA